MTQPQVLKGFRDFLPADKAARDFVMEKLTHTFQSFGFLPIETPTLEYRETIMGKYGDEADKLVYQFIDNGDREVALRYDQTVPTARFIANHFGEITFPFRRYQMQNVFRADKPQRGRYREFTQCDIDLFGSTDPIADAEVLSCVYAAYSAIGFTSIQIQVNDRQTLVSALEGCTKPGVGVFSLIQSIDKLDKLPPDEVIAELVRKGLSNVEAARVLDTLSQLQPSANLEQILSLAQRLGVPTSQLTFNAALARGLDYYTGMIFEVRIPEYTVGSVCGGGRYDNLIEQLSGIKMPAVGMAVGFDRTVEAAKQLGLLQDATTNQTVLVTVFDEHLVGESATITTKLREAGIPAELYSKVEKLGKQFKYADKRNIRYVVVLGSDEQARQECVLKDLKTGEQESIAISELVSSLQSKM
ncbi:histidine--tRNA ligase [Candidatus Woesebacteria bacterium]|nr:histidine--tRNA ligase [Candidatus Woesebacteria bacterium]